jgi:hypothetical protein
MNQETWWDYFDEDPNEEIGRQVVGLFDEPITIAMPRISWAYLDWMKSELGGDLKGFFQKCETIAIPHDECRNEAHRNAVYYNYIKRESKGLSRPPWCRAATKNEISELLDGLVSMSD